MFLTRLISSMVIMLITVIGFAFGNIILCVGLCAISLIAFRELTRVLKAGTHEKRFNMLELIGAVGIVVYYVAVYMVSFAGTFIFMVAAIAFMFTAFMIAYVITYPKYTSNQTISCIFAFVYAPVMLSFVYLTRETTYGICFVWLLLISSWGCDTCAYMFGLLFGKHKAFPKLSPKKTIEGCIGGIIGSSVLGGLYAKLFMIGVVPVDGLIWKCALLCGFGGAMSMLGDLSASAIKRSNGVKDYGKLIPGHGGIMDRFDSTIVVAPMMYFLVMFLMNQEIF